MNYTLTSVTPPTDEPVSVSLVKAHLRVDHNDEDDLIASYMQAARESLEIACNRSFVTQTWDLTLPRFPCGCIYLPRSPVASVTSITYYDTSNALQTLTLATYVDQLLSAEPAELHLKYGVAWPSTYSRPDAVKVRYVAGTAADSVPGMVKNAIRVLVGDWYENRSSVVTGTISSAIASAAASSLRAQYEIPDMSGLM